MQDFFKSKYWEPVKIQIMIEKKSKESEKHRGIVDKKYKMKELCETRKKRLSREINLLNSNKTG